MTMPAPFGALFVGQQIIPNGEPRPDGQPE